MAEALRWIDPVAITLIGGMVVSVIAALVTGIVTVITAVRVTTVSTAQAVTASSLLTVAKDTETIKGHVNSEKTAAEGREAALRKENDLLREIIADKKATASLLAQATAVLPVAAQILQAAALPVMPVADAPKDAV